MFHKKVVLLFLFLNLFLGSFLFLSVPAKAQEISLIEGFAASDHFLLQFEPWSTEEQREQLFQDANLVELRQITGQLSVVKVMPPEEGDGVISSQALLSAMEMVNQSVLVDYAEPDFLNEIHAVPNDAYYAGYQYYLNNTGQTIMGQAGYADDDIDAPGSLGCHAGQ